MNRRLAMAIARFDEAELKFCRCLNRSTRSSAVCQLFRAVSWLGDGWLWCSLTLALPAVYGLEGLRAALHVAVTGTLGLLLYKLIKGHAVRERPYITHSAIECASVPLDRYSFPSGHTLHAVSFTILFTAYLPAWTAALISLTALIALSRVILGLHYPTDVVAGAVLGGALGFGSVLLGPQWFA